jgi:hypothetical protein
MAARLLKASMANILRCWGAHSREMGAAAAAEAYASVAAAEAAAAATAAAAEAAAERLVLRDAGRASAAARMAGGRVAAGLRRSVRDWRRVAHARGLGRRVLVSTLRRAAGAGAAGAAEVLFAWSKVAHARVLGRGLHSSTSQLNFSRCCHRTSMKPPSVSLKSAHDKPKSWRV